ncbi:MAG: uracil-DNA glycosylase 2 [Cyclobacteriaceae bacterium]|nr:MAG: uracil-DNA glycosylase 2 [Cyclobacteriaceae bacterium]
MDVRIEAGWKQALQEEFSRPYFKQLTDFVREEYQTHRIFPPANQIFSAFDRCSIERVKVVILGQDPYHGVGQANGLCFSVNDNIPKPPSLLNIFKELESDLGIVPSPSGNLERWADQGVLLLNATLTVRANQAGSHQGRGWEQFTDQVIKVLASQSTQLVFILWGSYAQKKGAVIDNNSHMIIKSPHPSPLSAHRGFFGSKPFSKTNAYLEQNGKTPIKW